MTGYVRTDTVNNIADGNVISAADLDGEFNGVQAAFNSSTGHTHDGTASEGAPITKLGPVQDVTISTTVLGVKTTNTVDLGTSSLKFKDFYLAGAASIGGTLGVTGATTLSAALTYGGVTLSNAVTGTGNMVLSASPTITGTITAAAANFSGAVALNGNATIGDADTDTITQAASYVTGTQLKSAKTATNTLALAAYDVDGAAYTNLITLTASNTPTLALTSTGVGTINNMSIGATTASTGAFTTLTSTGDLSAVNDLTLTNSAASYGNSNNFILFKNSSAATVGGITHPAVTTLGLWGNTGVKIFNGSTAATTIADFTSTGLAVTGTLSATGNLTSPTLQLGTNPAGVSIGVLGIPNQKRVYGRNAANSADVNILYVDGSNGLVLGPSDAATITSAGFLTVTGGATIQGLTVGLGGGAVASNTAVGVNALAANTTGSFSTAIGNGALAAQTGTAGVQNIAVGNDAAGKLTTGTQNTAVGISTLGWGASVATTGTFNATFGQASLYLLTSGSYNTALGAQALYSNTTASYNTALGNQAGYSNQTGAQVSYIGHQSGYWQTGSLNVSLGSLALYGASGTSTGANNVAIGASALFSNTTASYNTAVGYTALYTNQIGTANVAIGPLALYATTASYNTAVGYAALRFMGASSGSTAVGYQAAYSGGEQAVTAFGYQAGYSQAGANPGSNTWIGYQAGYFCTSGGANTALGYQAYANASNATGSYNTSIGMDSLRNNTSGSSNTVIGYQAGYANVTGSNNAYIGASAGSAATGSSNTFVGIGTGELMTTGVKNTILGRYNGNLGGLDLRTSSNNIVLADGDGNPRFWVDGSGNLYGYTSNVSFSIPSTGGYSRFGSINATNVLQVAYNSTTSGVSLTSAATSWGTFSDQRLKNVTGVYENALADIAQIEPIKFTWKSDESNKPCVGVLAHTVKAVVPEAVEEVANSMEDETLYLQVRYTELIPLMIASIKELKAEIDSLKSQLNQGA